MKMANFWILYLIVFGQKFLNGQIKSDISRLNAGVQLNYKGMTPVVSARWRHVAIIKLPDAIHEEFEIGRHIRDKDLHADENQQLCQRARSNAKVQEACKRQQPHLNLIHEISNDVTAELNDLLQNIYAITPTKKTQALNKRGLLTWIGQGIGHIFGLATESDIRVLKLTAQEAAAKSHDELKTLKRFSDDLASYASQTNTAILNLGQKIKQMQLNQWRLNENARYYDSTLKEYEMNITLKLAKLMHHSFLYKTRLMQLQEAIEDMISGIVSPTLIAPETVEKLYNEITEHLKGTSFKIAFTQIDWFYKNVEFAAMRENNTLFLSLKIPLTTFEEPFDVYQIQTVPLPTHDSEGHVTHLTNMPQAIALSQDRQYYVDMTLLELRDHKLHARGLYKPVLQKFSDESCLGAIFQSNVNNTAKYCEYVFEIRGRKSSVTLLHGSHVLLTHTNLTVVCDNGTRFVVACASCVYDVPPNCHALNEQYFISAMQTDEHKKDKNSNNTGHIINVVWLQTILSETKKKFLQDIDLTELLNDHVIIKNLPTFNMLNETLQEAFVSVDRNIMTLDTAAQALRDDAKLISNLEDAVYFSTIITQDSWQESVGIVLIIVTIMAGLTIAYLVGLTCYVRKLTIALLVLGARVETVKADIFIDFLDTVARNETLQTKQRYVILQQVHEKAALTSVLLTTIIISYLLYRLWRKSHMKAKRWQLTFALQFTTTNEFLLVPLHILPGLPEDYRLEANQFISDIQVGAWWRKYLTFTWPSAQLRNVLTMDVCQLNTDGYTITWYQAYRLQRILRDARYVCLPAMLDRNSLHRMITHLIDLQTLEASIVTNV